MKLLNNNMSLVEEKLNIENQFIILKTKLQELLKQNLDIDILNQLILLCETYNTLQVTEIQQSEQVINKLYNIVNLNKNLPVTYKKQLLNIIKELQKLINRLIVNTIINSI